MPYEFSNWRWTQVTNAQTDGSQGTPLLTTGRKPRAIFQLACYSSGNTAAAQVAFVVVPNTAAEINTDGQVAIAGEISFNLGSLDSDLSAATEVLPLVWGPFATKGAGVGSPIAIIPPNSMVVTTMANATNGETISTCYSAEF